MKMRKYVIVTVSLLLSCGILSDCAEIPAKTPPERVVIRLTPEAFVVSPTHILVVNHNNAVDPEWLNKECEYMRRQLSVNVKATDYAGELGSDYRDSARRLLKSGGPDAKILILITADKNAPAIMTAPYENWAVMNSDWVKSAGGDDDTVNLRLGKRIFQALGHCVGAGYRWEREANLRFTPNPESLDDCLSHGFHPLNQNIFNMASAAMGLERSKLKPRKELIRLGILPPPKKHGETPAAEPNVKK